MKFSIFFLIISLFTNYTYAVTEEVPKLHLDFWNLDYRILDGNNCYNYATNRVTNSFAQPGEASNKIYSDFTCEDVYAAADEDLGLEATDFFEFDENDTDTLIALVVGEDWDFHWYRRDDNGLWSHKPGSTAATNLDEDGELIEDPETANRGFYESFCGYFKVKNYVIDEDEQDAGYVLIGNMKDLPLIEEGEKNKNNVNESDSYIAMQIYSGRRNPKLSLQQIIKERPDLIKSIERMNAAKKWQNRYVVRENSESRLGYNGFVINDKEGLLFSKGTKVYIKEKTFELNVFGFDLSLGGLMGSPNLEKELKKYFASKESL